MNKNIYNNVVGNRVLDNGTVVEDITSITLPNMEHPTSTINGNGQVMDLEYPNQYHFNAMTLSISHNYGKNCEALKKPGVHNIEVRIAREKYDTVKTNMGHEGMKVRCKVMHASSQSGTIENGNPVGMTENFSVIRYEAEVNGKIVDLVDAGTGEIIIAGKKVSDNIESLLS